MFRKENISLIFRNFPIQKRISQVPFLLLPNHGVHFIGMTLILHRTVIMPPSILKMIHYPNRSLFLAQLVSAGMRSI